MKILSDMFVVFEAIMIQRVLTNQLILAWRKISEDQTGGDNQHAR